MLNFQKPKGAIIRFRCLLCLLCIFILYLSRGQVQDWLTDFCSFPSPPADKRQVKSWLTERQQFDHRRSSLPLPLPHPLTLLCTHTHTHNISLSDFQSNPLHRVWAHGVKTKDQRGNIPRLVCLHHHHQQQQQKHHTCTFWTTLVLFQVLM